MKIQVKQNLIKFCFLLPRERWRKHQHQRQKKTSEINEVQKIENKEKTKIIKTINVISSKVGKYFFDVIDKLNDEETQRNYLQNLKNLILMENSNKTQEIKPTQYSMDEIFNRLKKTQKPTTIEGLK